MVPKKARKSVTGVIIPIGLIILSIFLLFLGATSIANNGTILGISIPSVVSNALKIGSTGTTITLSNGTQTQVAVIPSGQIGFKMSIVATYADGSTETIFEKSTLPGLAVVLNGKEVTDISAISLVAIGLDHPLPAGTYADFQLNYTALISSKNDNCRLQFSNATGAPLTNSVICSQVPQFTPRLIAHYQEIQMPLVSNGTLAVAALPALDVVSGNIFPSSASDTRSVDWTVQAHVRINTPNGQLSFLGSDLAYADLNFDGTLAGGCTNCATPPGAGIGGVTVTPATTPGGSQIDNFYDDPCQRVACTPTPPPPPQPSPAVASVQTIAQTQTVQVTQVSQVTNYATLAQSGAVIQTTVTPDATVTQKTVTRTTEATVTYKGRVIGDTHYDSEGNISGGHGVRVMLCVVGSCQTPLFELPSIPYVYLNLSQETVRVDPWLIIAGIILVALVVALALLLHRSAKHKHHKKR